MPLPKVADAKESNYGYVFAVSGPGKFVTGDSLNLQLGLVK